MDQPLDSLLPPRCRERYRPEAPLGRGGAGIVLKAIQRGLDRPVALKVLHKEILAEPGLVERFKLEARITAALTHPAIVRILDHDVEDGVPWIAYEFLPGPSLRAHLAPGPLNWPEALAIIVQVAGALDAAHSAAVLHRDVKPDNVLRAAPGRWKVTDFGIAKTDRYDLQQTQTGLLMGTPAYLAPEHIDSGSAGPASDQYALGITLFEMLTGRRPFFDANPIKLLEKHLTQPPLAPSECCDGIPPEVDRLVLRMLAKSPHDRYHTAGDLRAAALEVLGPDASVEIRAGEGATDLAASSSQLNLSGIGGWSRADLASGGPAAGAAPAAAPAPKIAPGASQAGKLPLGSSQPKLALPAQTVPLPASASGVADTPNTVVAGSSAPKRPPRAQWPQAVVGAVLVVLAVALWPRGPKDPVVGPSPSASASAAPASKVAAWELTQMRKDMTVAMQRHERRQDDIERMAAALNPGLPNLPYAAEAARKLKADEEQDLELMNKHVQRLDDVYPRMELVPEAELAVYTRVMCVRFRAWSWVQNTAAALTVAEKHIQKDHGIGPDPLADLESRPYPPEVVTVLGRALDAFEHVLPRLIAHPEQLDPELADVLLELNWVGVNFAFRTSNPTIKRRLEPRLDSLRQTAVRLPGAIGPAMGRVAMAMWDLGTAHAGVQRTVRDQLNAALGELSELAPRFPRLADVRRRIEASLGRNDSNH